MIFPGFANLSEDTDEDGYIDVEEKNVPWTSEWTERVIKLLQQHTGNPAVDESISNLQQSLSESRKYIFNKCMMTAKIIIYLNDCATFDEKVKNTQKKNEEKRKEKMRRQNFLKKYQD
jgi:hypothetical protein